jgi:hypothetical protein
MMWAGHVARMGEERKVYKVLVESPKERDHWEDQGVGGKMGSEWILERLAWECGLDSTGSEQGPVAGCCECGDEPLGFAPRSYLVIIIWSVIISMYFSQFYTGSDMPVTSGPVSDLYICISDINHSKVYGLLQLCLL